jgi:hypothetical protein
MFLPVPDELRAIFPPISSAALPMPVYRGPAPADAVPHRRDPRHDVREFAAFDPANVVDSGAVARKAREAHAAEVYDARKAAMAAAGLPAHSRGPMWWEDPIALGAFLIMMPPIGVAIVWTSRRYSADARWALTIMTALTMCLITGVAIVALLAR